MGIVTASLWTILWWHTFITSIAEFLNLHGIYIMDVGKDTINSLVWPAYRYALGRQTGAVDTVCRAIRNVKKLIRSDIKEQMIKEIKEELNRKYMDSDPHRMYPDNRHLWQNLIEELEKD